MYKELEKLQAAFLNKLKNPKDEEINLYLSDVYKSRFKIYENAYVVRLLNCLCDSYSYTYKLIGENVFKSCAFKYISNFPSTNPSINMVSMGFVDYLQSVFGRGYIYELALLELSVYRAIHLPPGDFLTADKLRGIQPESWGELRFSLIDNASFVEFNFNVMEHWENNNIEENININKMKKSKNCLFWRSDSTIKYKVLDELSRDFLMLLTQNLSFEQICEKISIEQDVNDLQVELLKSISSLVYNQALKIE